MKTKSVTIVIPAHNEGKNIGLLLDSIAIQKHDLFKLDKTIIACDGCTDNTSSIVKEYMNKYKNIQLIDDGKRLGKASRLNNFYKSNKSDILISLDGDIVLSNTRVIEEIVKSFEDNHVGLVGGCDMPNKPSNFVQKVASVWIDVWYQARVNYKDGITVNNHKGCISAVSRDFSKQINIPKNIVVGEEDYLYFQAKVLNFKFKFAKKAIIYYSVPATLHEFFVQTTRFLSAKNKIAKHFGKWVYQEYKIPTLRKIKALLEVFVREPIYLPIAIIMQILQRIFKSKFSDNYQNGFWVTIKSSK